MQAEVLRVLEADKGFLDHYGMECVAAAHGRAVVRAQVADQMVNAAGYAQGGLAFALADSASAYALLSAGVQGVTLNANLSYLKAARAGMALEAVARVVKVGSRVAHLEAEVRSGEQPIARGAFVFMLPKAP